MRILLKYSSFFNKLTMSLIPFVFLLFLLFFYLYLPHQLPQGNINGWKNKTTNLEYILLPFIQEIIYPVIYLNIHKYSFFFNLGSIGLYKLFISKNI